MLQQQYQIELAIEDVAPRIYEQRWPEWVQRDAELAHDADRPHPACGICTMMLTIRERWSPPLKAA